MTAKRYRTLEEVRLERYKKNPKQIQTYLAVALEEYKKDGDEKAFLTALAFAAKVHGGFSKISKATGLNRENLYRALSKRSNPRLSTVMQVLDALGFALRIEVKKVHAKLKDRKRAKVSLKKVDHLIDEKLMTPEFRRGYKAEYKKALLIQKGH